MKKINLKIFTVSTFVLIGVSLFFIFLLFISNIKVLAQEEIGPTIDTIGYSVLSSNNYVLGGYYSGNLEKKGFTTYFEYKEDDSNLNSNQDETIKIVRNTGVDENGVFYTSPELNLFSTYYFRAVGYFNDNPSQKFYGNTLILETGYLPIAPPFSFFPIGVSVTSIKDYLVTDYNIPNTCDFLGGLVCKVKSSETCPAELELDKGVCIDKTPKSIDGGWSTWSAWSSCSVKACGQTGKQTKSRTCNNPFPINGGTDCIGSTINTQPCSTKSCAKDTLEKSDTPKDTRLVPCTNNCGFNDIFKLINNVINFVIFRLVVPIAAILFAYAGLELLFSGGETSKREKAKKIFTNVAVGLIIVAAAFLIIQTILSIVGYNQSWNWFGF